MEPHALTGHWFVSLWNNASAGIVRINAKDNTWPTECTLQRLAPTSPQFITIRQCRWEPDRERLVVTASKDGVEASLWLRPEASGNSDAWFGMMHGGHLIARARRIRPVPDWCKGRWTTAPMDTAPSQRPASWTWSRDGDHTFVDIQRKRKVVRYAVYCLDDSRAAAFVFADSKGTTVHVSVWPEGDGWLVCEQDRSLGYAILPIPGPDMSDNPQRDDADGPSQSDQREEER